MQTVKVTVSAANGGLEYNVDGHMVATIRPDWGNAGRYAMSCGVFCNGNNMRLADAVEAMEEAITSNLGGWGLGVEFVDE